MRDKTIAQQLQAKNKKTSPQVTHDKQAAIRKKKNKNRYSYKKQVSVDTQSELINKETVCGNCKKTN